MLSVSELCRLYNISRKTGYKWIDRYLEEGATGLADRSRLPHHCPHQTPADQVASIVGARGHHPTWGAKKLLKLLSYYCREAKKRSVGGPSEAKPNDGQWKILCTNCISYEQRSSAGFSLGVHPVEGSKEVKSCSVLGGPTSNTATGSF